MSRGKKIIKFDSGLNSAVEVTCPTKLKTGKPPRFIPTANVSRIGLRKDGTIGVKDG